jgi:hypothetical protein
MPKDTKTIKTKTSTAVENDVKSKASKIKDTDKGDYANKETAFVNLEINVKPFRKWIKEHYERQSKSAGIINAHYILAAVDQIVIFSFLHSLSDSFKKTKSGMYDVSLESMKNHIRLTPHLHNTFYLCVDKFDENLDYQKQLSIDRKALDQYITKYVFNDNFRMNMSKDSMNFLTYLVVQTNVMLANTSLVMSEFAKKSRVNSNAVISAIKIHFSGKLLEDIMKKVDSVDTLLKNKEKQDSEKGDSETGEKKTKDAKKSDDESGSESEDEEEDKEKDEDEDEDESDKSDKSDKSDSESEDDEKPQKKDASKKVVKSKRPSKKVNKSKNHK